ncbi:MAG TPA: Sec-independent protein translocase protein TatB [Trinickia sp.]|jgi:sec-independent protein translocase protein TatB|uniref:Sec-independent protein translocase protein TatB n=1 Tax=Trinickia sp. TaxID=2571163 RepID=UPI002C5DB2E0|nr:Sec-independent protein translocase protein TatB [Trinickia sp.]HTI16145.1 Sec-independent protein translocase protein TatB [Trinickia sp.]
MLDLGLTKMALIGVVALVVLGPERLPRVARTAGALFGRAQRYINDVKAEVSREIEVEELRRMKTDFESAARNVESTIHENVRRHESDLTEALQAGMPGSPSIAGGASASTDDALASGGAPDGSAYSGGGLPGSTTGGAALPTAEKRRNWKAKRLSTPVWYKRATGRRTRVQSGAARVARHTPVSLRTPRRFL